MPQTLLKVKRLHPAWVKRQMSPSPEVDPVILGQAVDKLLCKLEDFASWWAGKDDKVKKEIRQDLMTYLKAFYDSDLTPPKGLETF